MSDWSSDVGSSDFHEQGGHRRQKIPHPSVSKGGKDRAGIQVPAVSGQKGWRKTQPGHRHPPVKSALRRSLKAATPSAKSFVVSVSMSWSVSMCMRAAEEAVVMAFTVCVVIRTVTGGMAAADRKRTRPNYSH